MEAFATAAAAFFIGITKNKAAFQLFLDVIHLSADQKHDGFRVDEHPHAIALDYLIEFTYFVGVLNRIG